MAIKWRRRECSSGVANGRQALISGRREMIRTAPALLRRDFKKVLDELLHIFLFNAE